MKSRPVTLQQLQDWVKANEGRTWYWDRLDKAQKLSLEIKYLIFSLDTRDMEVWKISVDGANDIHVRDGEDFDGTILELLDKKLDSKGPDVKE